MKTFFKFGCIFAMIIFLIAAQSCSNQSKRMNQNRLLNANYNSSALMTDKNEVRYGEVNKTDRRILSFSFDLTNSSDTLLTIDKVDVSCSCVSVKNYPNQLEIGQSGKLNGEIDLENQLGHIRKSIFVNYNDTCIKVLKIVGDIIE